jgi:metal-dependent amidase/aminoacylase/carboxypeptidase family protein
MTNLFGGTEKQIEGAIKNMIGGVSGILCDGGKPGCAFDLPAGKVYVVPGPCMASADLFTIEAEGKGTFSTPSGNRCGCHHHEPLNHRKSRVQPMETVVVHVGRMEAGGHFNIIASKATLEGINRYFNPQVRADLHKAVKRIAENTAYAFRAKADVNYRFGCPPTQLSMMKKWQALPKEQ